jgi:sulfite exporter TauE/SafE
MNMVALLVLGLVLKYNLVGQNPQVIGDKIVDQATRPIVGVIFSLVAIAVIVWAVNRSKRPTPDL